ncbi:MAG: hypothetical protein JJE30_16275 [Desulfuromonadales bacterium]|nr:hypothetical protein [Desulfuromonadales bacterium]
MSTTIKTGVQITFPLGQPERLDSYRDIDPARKGMFVEGASVGVAFIPGEARTASWAFREALRRLGEREAAAVTVYGFQGRGNFDVETDSRIRQALRFIDKMQSNTLPVHETIASIGSPKGLLSSRYFNVHRLNVPFQGITGSRARGGPVNNMLANL